MRYFYAHPTRSLIVLAVLCVALAALTLAGCDQQAPKDEQTASGPAALQHSAQAENSLQQRAQLSPEQSARVRAAAEDVATEAHVILALANYRKAASRYLDQAPSIEELDAGEEDFERLVNKKNPTEEDVQAAMRGLPGLDQLMQAGMDLQQAVEKAKPETLTWMPRERSAVAAYLIQTHPIIQDVDKGGDVDGGSVGGEAPGKP